MSRAADNLFSKAEQAIKRRNFDYAIELLLQGLKLDPLNVEQRKRLRNTEILAVQEKGGNPKGDLKTGLVTLKTQWAVKKLGLAKKWEEQIVEIENYLRHAPQNVGMLTVLAQALRSLENGTEAAIAVLLQIVELDPGQVETWRQLGILYGPIDPQKAIACWEKVKRYKPEDKEAGKAIRDLSAQTMMKSAEDRKKSGKGDFTDLLASADEAKKLEEEQAIIRTDDDARAPSSAPRRRSRKPPRRSASSGSSATCTAVSNSTSMRRRSTSGSWSWTPTIWWRRSGSRSFRSTSIPIGSRSSRSSSRTRRMMRTSRRR